MYHVASGNGTITVAVIHIVITVIINCIAVPMIVPIIVFCTKNDIFDF